MRLRLDLLKHLTAEDILEEVLANNHRYKPEPHFAKTEVGYLAPTTPEDREREMERSKALIERLERRARESQGKGGKDSSASGNL